MSNRIPRLTPIFVVAGILMLSACSKTKPLPMPPINHGPLAPLPEDQPEVQPSPTPPPPPPSVKPPEPKPVEPPKPVIPNWWKKSPPKVEASPTPFSFWPSARPSSRPSPAPVTLQPTPPTEIPTYSPVDPISQSPLDLMKYFTRSYAQSFGVYDNGHLEKPDSIPSSGEGFLKVFQDRDRRYGSFDLLNVVRAAAKEIHRDIPATEVLQIGDISSKTGGRLGGHGSHQNGLDADLAYFKNNHRVMAAKGQSPGATGFDERFVTKTGAITPNFDIDTNWRFIQILIASGRIDRIFADQHIKKAFCQYAVAKGMRQEWAETLRKLRHWTGHQDHMHIRLTCPPNSTKCKPISAIPAGDGCDRLLGRDAGAGGGGLIRMDGVLDDSAGDEHGDGDVADEHGC